jgi:hypothetical protein
VVLEKGGGEMSLHCGEMSLQSVGESSRSYVPKISCSCETKLSWWRELKRPRLRIPDSCARISFSIERGKKICVSLTC